MRIARQSAWLKTGPLIYAEAGSTVRILFRNNLEFPVNMEPAGGATWRNPERGFLPPVPPGAERLIEWQASPAQYSH
jgi:hypothetical protein